ncbi:MAG: response regulator [Candidatus Omnitrophica bacterium]|nr:response regulator [Candidatus Omnitrophota bacterium]MDD5488425.1 response regulator [Candidatus Omnitrophota bacterium]
MPKIMVVDDQKNVCDLLAYVFENEGYEIICETSSVIALERVIKEKPDCVLLDLVMPDMDGIEFLIRVRKEISDIKIIIMTAHGDYDNATKCKELGAYAYIPKPFDVDVVKATIRKCLGISEDKLII